MGEGCSSGGVDLGRPFYKEGLFHRGNYFLGALFVLREGIFLEGFFPGGLFLGSAFSQKGLFSIARVHMNVVPRSTMDTNGGTEN